MTFRPRFRLVVLFALSISATPIPAADLELTENENVISIGLRGKPVLEYVKTEKPVPEGIDPAFRRSGYIHPVFSPLGQEVTGDFAPDHAHQHAIFFAWTKATFKGKQVDFWNQAKQLGGVEHRGVTAIDRQPDQVSFSVEHAFMAGTGDQRTDVLKETWKVTVYETPGDYFLFDIESVQECVADQPLIVDEYHYGGMGVRGNSQWLEDGDAPPESSGLHFLTSEGKDRLEGNHSRPTWVAMSGPIDGQPTSLTVMCSPQNFRFPQPVRLHPTKPYFCFAPMVTGPFSIEPGETYVSRYRYLVRSTAADIDQINEHWEDYVESEKQR